MPEPSGDYSLQVQAEAYAKLMGEGKSSLQVQRETGIPGSTLRRWRERWSSLNTQELRDNEHVIALRGQELIHRTLDAWNEPDVTSKDLRAGTVAINALVHTAYDKATQGSQPQGPGGPLVIAIFPGDTPPPTIDATAETLPD